jgi:CheY-like chemotaxis protein
MGLLLCRDLLFTSKVTGEARAQGTRVLVAGDSALACSLIEQWRPKVLFLDLAADELTRPAAILAYRQITGPDVPFIAFGSHVDTAALASARDAGCDVVLPRSKFTTDLPGLIRHHLTGESTLG